jgi:hypothetical protein
MHADSLTIKAHIPWGGIEDFEFYNNGVFIGPIGVSGIGYFVVDDSFNLSLQYIVSPGGQCFCVTDSLLFSLSGRYLCVYTITDSSYEYISNLELSGHSSQYDPIIFCDSSIICQSYPGNYRRISVSNPYTPYVTGQLLGTDDVSCAILSYQDSLLLASRQQGMTSTGNLRVIRNNVQDTLISLGVYGNRPSYTRGIVNIDSVLFTAHRHGLVVYDISEPYNIQEIFFYSTAWGRYVEAVNNYVFMSCNDGWHVFQYVSPNEIYHLQHFLNDTRAMWIKERPGKSEIWSYVDGGSLAGLVVFDVSGFTGVYEDSYKAPQSGQFYLRISPNPFQSSVQIRFVLRQSTSCALNIYNTQGQLMRTLIHGYYPPGTYTINWDGTDDHNVPTSSGIYFCDLKIRDGLHEISKVLRVRR